MDYRMERDSMGEMKVPVKALYAAQTQRAVENFPISSLRFGRSMIRALGIIKHSAAEVNAELGLLDKERAELIKRAAKEVENGQLDEHFVVDIFQTGSGTSSNMNTNEVIATRAMQLAESDLKVHPNDHVNMSQSSNDVIPTAIHIAAALQANNELIPALKTLEASLGKKAAEFADVVKTGRTHLQDATPITLGQEFSGYNAQIRFGIERVTDSLKRVFELAQGGTAVGTGLNTHPEFAAKIAQKISAATKLPFIEARNHFEAQGAKDAVVELSGQLRTVAVSLSKIANDVRWLACGPRCGLGEIALPEVQPGSSIMPGKVNPVISESVLMACAQVIGNDTTVAIGGLSGSVFELNVMMPVMAHNVLESISLLAASAANFAAKCVDGITANTERLHHLAEASIATCTALAPIIGYDTAADIAKEAFKTGESIRAVTLRRGVMSEQDLDKALDLIAMTKPGV
ncbi:MAG: class II fumarate hydratase [Bdellovibrionales bacterium]|nr:class II fumarate hydratase [Bdellovibrionales bacterium]